MNRTYFNLIVSLVIFFHFFSVSGQKKFNTLSFDSPISAEIVPGERHQYKVKLEKDQFAFFKLMQNGVDVVVKTLGVKEEKLEEFDTPNGKFGPELFSIRSSIKGDYIIEVSPLDGGEPKGNYELMIHSIRSKAVSIEDRVDELFIPWDSNETPGVSIAIVKDGELEYSKGYGMSNLEYDIPNSSSTIFHIASISKQFTVFSVLLLESQGKLSLEDDIRKYIPEVPDFGKKITLGHLASHTSGLRDQWNLLAMAGWRLDDVITKEHILKLVSRQKALNFNPGDQYMYCNTGFTLLAEVVSRVSGKSFAEFTKASIFEPLSMNNTLFYDDHEKIVKNRAYSYSPEGIGFKKSVLSYANVGATSLFTTVEDLALWSINFSELKVGNAAIVDKMNTPAILNNGEEFGGALGQFVGNYKGLHQIQHGGADAGYRTYLGRFPNQDFSVITFSNDGTFNAGGMALKIADIYLENDLVESIEKIEEESNSKPTRIAVTQEILNSYVGDYELQPGFVISISMVDGLLKAQATGQQIIGLNANSTTEFKVEKVDAIITFIPSDNGSVELLKLKQGGQLMDAPRIKPFDKTSVDLSEFTGNFYSEELATSYHFKVVDNKLIAEHSRHESINLAPVKPNVFSGNIWFFGQVEFIRNKDAGISGCKVSAGRVKNLEFVKTK